MGVASTRAETEQLEAEHVIPVLEAESSMTCNLSQAAECATAGRGWTFWHQLVVP
jgi:hypothetical protein